jgi:tripeptidyl-peptidase I
MVAVRRFATLWLTTLLFRQVVDKFLKNSTAIPAAGTFNASGRGYPDIAGLAHNYYIEMGGSPTSVDGTSCSTPVLGGALFPLFSVPSPL